MSTYWICNNTDERFDTYDDAWEDYHEKCGLDVFADYFHEYVSYESLLNWAMQQQEFWRDKTMQNFYQRADAVCFDDHYIEHEEGDEE